jgi:DNA invertase Pin-like site-specific DNA recombinase
MLCAVCTRQSVRSEGDLTSCEVQREMCWRFAKARGFRVSRESFDDEGISGATLERPALQRPLSAVRTGSVAAVIVHRLDRLSRRVRDCAALLEEFKAHNVRLYNAAMPELSNGAADTLMLNIQSAFAEFERDMIASRRRATSGRRLAP